MWALDDYPLRFAAFAHFRAADSLRDSARLACVYDLEAWLKAQIGPRYQVWAWATNQGIQSPIWTLTFRQERDSCLFTLRWG
jgi:hypothetical protein